MSSSLILRLNKVVPFNDVLQRAGRVLLTLLNLDMVPPLRAEPPPRVKNAKHPPSLADRVLDMTFPGAYVCFVGDDESVVDCHVFEGGTGSTSLMLGIGSVSTPSSELLAAALAAAAAELMNAVIMDAGSHWTSREESTPADFIGSLAVQKKQTDFVAAVELSYRRMAGPQRPAQPKH